MIKKLFSSKGRWLTTAALVIALIGAYLLIKPSGISAFRIGRQDLVRTIVATGRVIPWARVEIGVRHFGTVSQLLVQEGDRVGEGQLLAQLEDSDVRSSLANSEAALEQARQRENQVAEVFLPRAQEELKQADIELEQARKDVGRQESLYRGGAISAKAFEDWKAKLHLAESRRNDAAIKVQSYSPQGQESRLTQAALAQAEAGVKSARVQTELHRITAPTSGIIIKQQVEKGDSVQPGMILFVLSAQGPVTLLVPFDEKNLSFLRTGLEATASADAYPAEHFSAAIYQIAPSVDPARGTVEVKLRVDAPPPYLVVDMTVAVELRVGQNKRALVAPLAAVHDLDSGRPWVLAVRDGRALRQPIQVGLVGESVIEVASGLQEGDIVLPVTAAASEGKKVRIRSIHEK